MGLSLQGILASVIIIGMVVFGAFAFITEQTTNTGQTQNNAALQASFSNTTSAMNETMGTAENLREKIESANLVSVDGFAALFSASFSILRIVLNVVFLPINIIIDIATVLGAPWWFGAGLAAIITLSVVLLIANIIFGRGRA